MDPGFPGSSSTEFVKKLTSPEEDQLPKVVEAGGTATARLASTCKLHLDPLLGHSHVMVEMFSQIGVGSPLFAIINKRLGR